MKKFLTIIGLVFAALVVSAVLVTGRDLLAPGGAPDAGPSPVGTPWQVEVTADGSARVAGLVLASGSAHGPTASTLADAEALWPQQLQVAIVAATGEHGALEALVDPASLGGITGKLVLSLAATDQQIEAMKSRAAQVEFMESTTRKFTLSADDLSQARQARITALAFIPQARLTPEMVISRFGEPGERVSGQQEVQHYLYPARGLDIALNPGKGKDVLQYVPPAQFEAQLRAPLHRALRPPASAPAPAATTTR